MEKAADLCVDECCAPPLLVLPPKKPSVDRVALIHDAFRLEWLTIGWMTVEAVVAVVTLPLKNVSQG
jgi:hypothetical protein